MINMYDLNPKLSPDQAVVMRAVWESLGWATVDEIMEKIWQDGFPKYKVRRILRELYEIHFVAIKKRGTRNYYAQKIGMSQYYPDLCENPQEFIKNETIELRGAEECLRKIRAINKMAADLKKLNDKQNKKSKKTKK